MAKTFENRLNEIAADQTPDPNISIVIRAHNERARLEKLLHDIERQTYNTKVEVVVVDNESNDGTAELARKFGAKVVTIPLGEFTYPRSMNLGVAAASNDVVMLTVAHTRLASPYTLRAAARHFASPKVGGVYAVPLPGDTARFNERLFVALIYSDWRRPAHAVERARIGVLGAANACIRKSVWQKLGKFDERFERGGEDTHLAAEMLKAGFAVIDEPAMIVYHDHGFKLVANTKQLVQAYATLRKPQAATTDFVARRRKHLR